MTTKLRVDLAQGILEVEGDEAFVRDIFSDFRHHLQSTPIPATQKLRDAPVIEENVEDLPEIEGEAPKPTKRGRARTTPRRNNEAANSRSKMWAPKIDNSVDANGLRDFIKPYALKGHSERILVYGKYLQSIGLYPFSSDQVYTCYMVLKDKIPAAFKQAFHDAKTKSKFIDFETPESIEIGIVGTNHFNHSLVQSRNSE